jgi:ribosomal protein S18 acetylase RimI-like enzyme
MNLTLKKLDRTDRAALEAMLSRVSEFDAEDVCLACELMDITLDQPAQKDYVFLVAANEAGQPLGFLCYGPTPLTVGTYDLYWIAVDPDCAGQGVGTRLVAWMEELICAQGGRLVLIETSSAPQYTRTRSFYLKNAYALVETIPDFYRESEDRVTYGKWMK